MEMDESASFDVFIGFFYISTFARIASIFCRHFSWNSDPSVRRGKTLMVTFWLNLNVRYKRDQLAIFCLDF